RGRGQGGPRSVRPAGDARRATGGRARALPRARAAQPRSPRGAGRLPRQAQARLERRVAVLVSRFMTRRPVTVAPEAPLEEATVLMERHGFRHLPVVTGEEVVGMLSDRDLRLGTGGHPLASLNLPDDAGLPRIVSEIMRAPVVCVESDERGPLAARHMIDQRIGALPVLEDGRLVGIVTETNLVSAFRDLCRDPAHADELDRPVEEIMHSPVITLEPGDSLA